MNGKPTSEGMNGCVLGMRCWTEIVWLACSASPAIARGRWYRGDDHVVAFRSSCRGLRNGPYMSILAARDLRIVVRAGAPVDVSLLPEVVSMNPLLLMVNAHPRLASNMRIYAQASDVPGALSKYIKRKKLDPLETYVPTILLAQSQFQEVDGRLEGEASKFADARSLLRNGPAASLRTDIRAVAQYAAESGNERVASAAVDQCLSALEDLDGLLFQASRSQDAPIEKMRQRLSTAVTAIDRLLATVPAAILEKGKAVAKAYRDSD
ncbi:hypothetical protein AXG93_3163s1040 [Marchantia polymorpha subsp. ruderalis]|uniref:DUF7880 domain-containing protein n=1 Tax=Marchantia polymorpha subsp. ruderalis TaxID=1480154 RepID=A0A176VSR7_MARPO|nr:hypothetical protein AXG93_3163s1040 [Marchantia polymorpha subsp. ruderalis]